MAIVTTKLSSRHLSPITPEEKERNRERTREFIKSWEAFKAKYPKEASEMVMNSIKGVINETKT